jgi:hypothetical protein
VIRSWTNRKDYSGKRVGKVLLASAALVAIGAATAFAASIPNGNFEEGNFSGWKKQSKGDGTWFVYTAKNRKVPGPGGATLPKPFGKYAAALKQSGPGTNYLTHTFRVPSGATTLSLKLFWINQGGPPPGLVSAQASAEAGYWRFPGEWSVTGDRIQFFTLDLVKPSASGFTTKKSDVVTTILKPKVGSTKARSGGWVTETIDVSRFRGEKIKLRLVEGDNSGYLNVGLDQVEFRSASTPTG